MKRSKRRWLLQAAMVFLGAVLGIFLLLPAGSVFAQADSVEARWADEFGNMAKIRSTTAVVAGGQWDKEAPGEILPKLVIINGLPSVGGTII